MSSIAPYLRAGKAEVSGSVAAVDRVNAEFYGRYPFPPPSPKFDYLDDPDFERVMLCQSIGDFTHCRLPIEPRIWVVGCGTNQAIQTALRFPRASVLGTDLSSGTLELVAEIAAALRLGNLDLAQQSLSDAEDRNRFDYILCTGVIHHNADPGRALATLARALKPSGILELMVYNAYHRILPLAFQDAVQLFRLRTDSADCGDDMKIASILAKSVPARTRMGQWLDSLDGRPESEIADLLIQPVEHTYTVASLATLAAESGLELLLPTLSPLMKYRGLNAAWDLELDDPKMRDEYERMPDVARWHLGNLLLNQDSPMLWFYLQRKDSPYPRRSERDLCDAFLDSRWMLAQTTQRSYIRDENGALRLSRAATPYPTSSPEVALRQILEEVNHGTSLRQIMQKLGWEPTQARVTDIRTKLAISVNPYLRSVAAGS